MQTAMRKPDDRPRAEGPRGQAAPMTRDERLKAALKANMARRKQQARVRAATGDRPEEGAPDQPQRDE